MMSKKAVLVHDCGHIVKPGDRLLLVDNAFNRTNPVDGAGAAMYEMISVCESYGGAHYIRVKREGAVNTEHRDVRRFDCRLVEVEDEETNQV